MGGELGLVAVTTSLQFAVFLMLGCCPLTWIHNPKILNLSPGGQNRPWDGMETLSLRYGWSREFHTPQSGVLTMPSRF